MIKGLSQSEFTEADFDPKRVIGGERVKPLADTGNSGNVLGTQLFQYRLNREISDRFQPHPSLSTNCSLSTGLSFCPLSPSYYNVKTNKNWLHLFIIVIVNRRRKKNLYQKKRRRKKQIGLRLLFVEFN